MKSSYLNLFFERQKILVLLVFCFIFTVNSISADNKIKPSDPQASPMTVQLYSNLHKLAKDKIMIGHQDALSYGVLWKGDGQRSDIKDISGSHPAVYGWDIGGIELGWDINLDGVSFSGMRENIIRAFENGGLNTISWHAFDPITEKDSWANTKTPNPIVSKMLPGGIAHQAFIKQLDYVAAFFKTLTDKHEQPIPIVFRPWHEHSGNWFWWGKMHCTIDEYVSLYRFTVSYLRNHHSLHNLIMAYSPDVGFDSKESYLERYPGDDVVDVIGVDDYHSLRSGNPQQLIKHLEIISAIANDKNKISAYTETGITDFENRNYFMEELYPCLNHSDLTRSVSWVLFWRNHDQAQHYVPYKGHPAENDFVEFCNQNLIILNNDLPDLYGRLSD